MWLSERLVRTDATEELFDANAFLGLRIFFYHEDRGDMFLGKFGCSKTHTPLHP
jgi:hypothetical protein